ncbi:MAG: hypothetical protein ACRDHL_11525 [Candidatus Promineifilaceae bacterium]
MASDVPRGSCSISDAEAQRSYVGVRRAAERFFRGDGLRGGGLERIERR